MDLLTGRPPDDRGLFPLTCESNILSFFKFYTMERYNIFQLIHKGLRAALYQTAMQLQQADFTSPEDSEETGNRVKEVVMLFDGHANKEDEYVFPAITSYEPSVTATFEAEHEKDRELGARLEQALNRVEEADTQAEKILTGRLLSESFTAFMVFNLQHMAKEEEIINKILWRYYSDEELKKLSGTISQSSPPWIQEFYVTWMLRGINQTEAVNWIKAIEKAVPPVVYQSLIQKAKQELPEKRFNKLNASLLSPAQNN
jgi:hemerythrin-like domain-containing protein